MFGFIYVVLLALWVFLLDRKIRHGPDPDAEPDRPKPGDVLNAAGAVASRSGALTGDREGS